MINILKADNKLRYISTDNCCTMLVVWTIYILAALFTILYGIPNTSIAFKYYENLQIKMTDRHATIIETQNDRIIKVSSTIRELDHMFRYYGSIKGLSTQVRLQDC